MKELVRLAAYAGLPLGDILALGWSEVELKTGCFRRRRQKTDEDLDIPVIPQLRDILLRAHMRQGRPRTGRVCSEAPQRGDSLTKPLQNPQQAVGIPKAPAGESGWHRYRRSLATNLMRLGVPVPVIGAILGHAHGSPATWIYEIPDRTDVEDAMRRYGEALE